LGQVKNKKRVKTIITSFTDGFLDGKLISVIKSYYNLHQVIKVKINNLNDLLYWQDWDKIPVMQGWEMTEFYYQAKG